MYFRTNVVGTLGPPARPGSRSTASAQGFVARTGWSSCSVADGVDSFDAEVGLFVLFGGVGDRGGAGVLLVGLEGINPITSPLFVVLFGAMAFGDRDRL